MAPSVRLYHLLTRVEGLELIVGFRDGCLLARKGADSSVWDSRAVHWLQILLQDVVWQSGMQEKQALHRHRLHHRHWMCRTWFLVRDCSRAWTGRMKSARSSASRSASRCVSNCACSVQNGHLSRKRRCVRQMVEEKSVKRASCRAPGARVLRPWWTCWLNYGCFNSYHSDLGPPSKKSPPLACLDMRPRWWWRGTRLCVMAMLLW